MECINQILQLEKLSANSWINDFLCMYIQWYRELGIAYLLKRGVYFTTEMLLNAIQIDPFMKMYELKKYLSESFGIQYAKVSRDAAAWCRGHFPNNENVQLAIAESYPEVLGNAGDASPKPYSLDEGDCDFWSINYLVSCLAFRWNDHILDCALRISDVQNIVKIYVDKYGSPCRELRISIWEKTQIRWDVYSNGEIEFTEGV